MAEKQADFFKLERQKSTSTPYILIDEEKNYMKIEGLCFNENVIDFFIEINDWLDKYLNTNFKLFTFDCAMEYFNSSTVKVLFNLIMKMDEASSGENKVILNWITVKENEIIIECGEDFREEVINLTFNMVIN
ncbi:MAG: DUF1987 domain-containing protein [Treponema sp.]|nr:DUF1987 domain-containing protein [Treponema sp.]MCL2250789.1 DUF1987 domain-containing protein [Treponema sp.]